MCLYALSNQIYTAKEDMTVYKVIKNNNKSLAQHFQYSPNTTYRLRKALDVSHRVVRQGFHSYSFQKFAGNAKTVKFIIPKGAKYILGTNYEIVSTSIRSGNLKRLKHLISYINHV